MGKSRACGFDIFALNDIIDNEKLSVLYQASLTECTPNDPFNDWSKVIDSIINIYLDIIDRISSEQNKNPQERFPKDLIRSLLR